MPAIDCNDQIAAINPGETEIIDDGIDNDCDGVSEMSDVVIDQPSSEPTSEPSDGTVNGQEVEGDKSGCSTLQLHDMGWILLAPMAMFLGRRRKKIQAA